EQVRLGASVVVGQPNAAAGTIQGIRNPLDGGEVRSRRGRVERNEPVEDGTGVHHRLCAHDACPIPGSPNRPLMTESVAERKGSIAFFRSRSSLRCGATTAAKLSR